MAHVLILRPVHITTPEKLESAALFLRFSVPSTLIRYVTELYGNAVQTGEICPFGRNGNQKAKCLSNTLILA